MAPLPTWSCTDAAWDAATTRNGVVAQVEVCAAPERNKSAEQREADRLAAYGYLLVDEVVKDPEAFNGVPVVAFADIVQWDVNTGTCSFHANFLGEQGGRYDYDGPRLRDRWGARAQLCVEGGPSRGLSSDRAAQTMRFRCCRPDDLNRPWSCRGVTNHS